MDAATSGTRDARRIGRYRLVAEIARGGMGHIYLAQASGPAGFQKFVVVKELKPELVSDDKFREMFLDEARLAARLNHRNIVQTNEVSNEDERYFMVMEHLDGRSLYAINNRLKGDALPLAIKLRVVAEILAGLHYAHELKDYDGTPLGIVHRDVSSQNALVTYDGEVKLIDFGVAKAESNTLETQAGMMKGRVVYMAPEHVANSAGVDRRADIFSAGVLLRELVTGKRVWDAMSEIEVMKRLISKEIPALPKDHPAFTAAPALHDVIAQAMAPLPADRYETAAQMRAALDAVIAKLDPTGAESLVKLGELVSTAFAAKREEFQKVIEKHVANADGDDAPISELPLIPLSDPFLESGGVSSAKSGARSGARSAGGSSGSPLPSIVGPSTMASEQASTSQMGPAPSGKKTLFAGIGIGLAVAAAGIVGFALRKPSAPAPVAAAPAVVTSAPAAAEPSAELVDLTVKGSPASAQIFVDDAAMPENPWHAKYKRGSAHSIRVVAPGYAPRSEQVTLSEASTVSITLDRQATAAAVPIAAAPRAAKPAADKPKESAPAPAAAPPTATDIVLTGGKAPKRAIDPKNPYEQ